eukprot:1054047-Pyramimonas_sp.AAC.1
MYPMWSREPPALMTLHAAWLSPINVHCQICRDSFCFKCTIGHAGLSTSGHALLGPRVGRPNNLMTGTGASMCSQVAGKVSI